MIPGWQKSTKRYHRSKNCLYIGIRCSGRNSNPRTPHLNPDTAQCRCASTGKALDKPLSKGIKDVACTIANPHVCRGDERVSVVSSRGTAVLEPASMSIVAIRSTTQIRFLLVKDSEPIAHERLTDAIEFPPISDLHAACDQSLSIAPRIILDCRDRAKHTSHLTEKILRNRS